MWYDKQGKAVTGGTLDRFFWESTHKVLKQETLPNGKWVSTVCLGFNHNLDGKKLIFETLVFPKIGNFNDLDCARYETEEEAIKGHEKMVAKWSK